jgi:hypothetical protein
MCTLHPSLSCEAAFWGRAHVTTETDLQASSASQESSLLFFLGWGTDLCYPGGFGGCN